jgi:hypothetical protein
LHDHTSERILVLSYTNHALDQMIVDIQSAGVPASSIVRLGGKSNASTQALSIFAQINDYRMNAQTRAMIQVQKTQAESYHELLSKKVIRFATQRTTDKTLLASLECSTDSEYFDAFVLPESEDNLTVVGRNNKAIEETYLLSRWLNGEDAGPFKVAAERDYPDIWNIEPDARLKLRNKWEQEIIEEQVTEISTISAKYNESCQRVEQLFHKKDSHIISNKRIVACTTTAAAKYTEDIQNAAPGIVLVEEAGEILESHILTAMTPATKQLILIGDHKQLRPKVNTFALTVEKGEGYDLNVSLYTRKVPHLSKSGRCGENPKTTGSAWISGRCDFRVALPTRA